MESLPTINRETEEELRRMFKEIQIPFHKFCPKTRKTFFHTPMSYKFVELLELDEFIPCFMFLKSREKLHQQDQIWKQICEYLKWQFIPMFKFYFFYKVIYGKRKRNCYR